MDDITFDLKLATTTIHGDIYRHFSEHLGRWMCKLIPSITTTGMAGQ